MPQEGEPDWAASNSDSTMATLDIGLPAQGSSCPDTATSPATAPAVSAASQALQENPEGMETDGNETAWDLHSTVGIVYRGLPASACPDTATSPATAPDVSAASQGAQESPQLTESNGSGTAVSKQTAVGLPSEDSPGIGGDANPGSEDVPMDMMSEDSGAAAPCCMASQPSPSGRLAPVHT